jgi:hypothetical protein
MRRATIVVCAVLLCVSVVYAEDKMDVRAQQIDGKSFVCFTEADSQKLLQLTLDYPKLQLQLKTQGELIDIKTKEISTLELANGNLREQNGVLVLQNTHLQQKIVDRDAWYKSPYLWFVVGLVVGTGVSITIFYLAK